MSYMNEIYYQPYTRIAPYSIGMICGYYMAQKADPGEDNERTKTVVRLNVVFFFHKYFQTVDVIARFHSTAHTLRPEAFTAHIR